MKIITGKVVADWTKKQILKKNDTSLPAKGLAIGFADKNEIVFGCIFSGLKQFRDGANVWATIAKKEGKRFRKKEVLQPLFSYAFDNLKASRITCQIAPDNVESIRLCENLGFTHEGTFRQGYDGQKDALLYGLLKEERPYVIRT